jgi:hypothetical protein
MVGLEPVGGTNLPVFVYMVNVGSVSVSDAGYQQLVVPMAARGFVAAMVVPMQGATCHLDCNGLGGCAQEQFGYGGPSDTTSSSALATLCRRPTADCTAGIALWGNSFGGLTLGNAPYFAPVTAMVLVGAGTYLTGGGGCCSYGIYPQTCCVASEISPGGIYGGQPWPCLMDSNLTDHLPRSRRRVIIGLSDHYYGVDISGSTTGPYGGFAQLRLSSGCACAGLTRTLSHVHRCVSNHLHLGEAHAHFADF